MIRKITLSPLVIFASVTLIFTGELVSGTNLYFASMASLAILFCCLTYNMLGGMGSISGIAFARFALSTLVISQIGKVLVLERADQNLDTPLVVISVYALYFFSAMVGVMLFSRLRLPLPKPVEPGTPTQSRYLYVVSFAAGLVAVVLSFMSAAQGSTGKTSLANGVSLLLGYFLPFSLVLAVDHRIRSTEGRHCFGWMALWPALTLELGGFLGASRTGFVEPFAIIFLAGYLRDFKFGKRHLAIATVLVAGFFLFVSPFYLYARSWRENPSPIELATTMIETLQQAPSQWSTIKYQVGAQALVNTHVVNYFSSPGAVTLNRFALIGPDSTLISVCSGGFHYAFTSLKLDLLSQIPRILYRNKPDAGSGLYLGQLDGQEEGFETTTNSTITPIADSYGAFGWVGVIVFAFLMLPAVLIVYESIFDMSKPWGTVAAVYLLIRFTEGSMGTIILGSMIKDPLYILCLSWGSAWIVRMIPATGDSFMVGKTLQTTVAPSGTNV